MGPTSTRMMLTRSPTDGDDPPPRVAHARRRRAMSWVRVLPALAGLAVIGFLAREVGPEALWGELRELSWRLPLLVLPYTLVAALDATGWRFAFPGRRPSVPFLMGARLAGEAVNVTTPTATIGGEPVKAWLVTRTGVPLDDGLVSVVIAKTALVISHLAFVTVGLGLAAWRPPAAPALLTLMAGIAAVGALAIGGFVWAQQRGLFGASGRALGWLGIGETVTGHLGRLDTQVRGFYASRRGALAGAILFHFLGWLAGSVEIWIALRLLGTPVDAGTAVVIEAFVSAIRSATFVIPASLGVQEGGFVGIFVGFGLESSAGLALGVIRRLREAVWAAIGYGILAVWGDVLRGRRSERLDEA